MTIDLSRYPVTGAYGLQPHAERVTRHVLDRFGAKNFPWVTGYRAPDGTEHPNRRSVDFGVSPLDHNPRTPVEEKLGDDVVAYALANRADLGTEAIFWNGWETGYVTPLGQWIKQRWQPPAWMIGRVDYDPFHVAHPHIRFSEKAPKGPAPKPAPAKDRTVRLIDERLGGHGAVIVAEAKAAGLDLALACALVEQESEGRNVFGCDHGDVGDRPPYCHQPVTPGRVQLLRDNGNYRHGMNGVGLTQLTWWEFVEQAEMMGGAHLPRFQCRVGFRLLKSYLDRYPYLEALGAYNAGAERRRIGVENGYAGAVAAKHKTWKERLVGKKPALKVPIGGRNKDGYALINIAALGKMDQVGAHALAALLWEAGVPVTVTGDTPESVANVAAMILREPLGYRQLWVMGRPALEACGDAAKYARYPISGDTDFYDFAGNGFVDSCQRIAGEAEKLVPGTREKFLALVNPAPPAPPKPEPVPKPGPVVPPAPADPTPDPAPEPPEPEPQPEPLPTPGDPLEKRLEAIEETLVTMDIGVTALANRVRKLEGRDNVTYSKDLPPSVSEGNLAAASVMHSKRADASVTSSKRGEPAIGAEPYDFEEDLTVPRRVRRQNKEARGATMHDATPRIKVIAATVGAALATLLVFLVEILAGIDLPLAVEGAIFTLCAFVLGYVVPEPSDRS
ncbi:MAG: hypothetical protein M3R38_28280 [Actinomycetota bacterium]|nr:hypothetical protein [Actinomycetota bacterium]